MKCALLFRSGILNGIFNERISFRRSDFERSEWNEKLDRHPSRWKKLKIKDNLRVLLPSLEREKMDSIFKTAISRWIHKKSTPFKITGFNFFFSKRASRREISSPGEPLFKRNNRSRLSGWVYVRNFLFKGTGLRMRHWSASFWCRETRKKSNHSLCEWSCWKIDLKSNSFHYLLFITISSSLQLFSKQEFTIYFSSNKTSY